MGNPRKGHTFSNSTDWEIWSSHWCNVCKVDEPAWKRGEYENGCPLIPLAMSGYVPNEWLEQPAGDPDRFHCINFRGEGDGPDEPKHPENPIPGQGELIPRAEYERPKVFADVAAEIRRVDA